jgi:hypothetical protein
MTHAYKDLTVLTCVKFRDALCSTCCIRPRSTVAECPMQTVQESCIPTADTPFTAPSTHLPTYQRWVQCQGALVALACMQFVCCHLPVPVPQPLKGLCLLWPLLSSSLKQLCVAVLTLTAQIATQSPVDPAG